MHGIVLIFFLILFSVVAVTTSACAIPVLSITSQGGVKAWLIEDHTVPLIAMDFLFRGGTTLDPAGQAGLATMTSLLLKEGAGKLDSLSFQRKLEDLGIYLSFSTDYDSFTGHLQTLTENCDVAFTMLKLAITAPRFDAEALERVRVRLLAALKQQTEDPNNVARESWFTQMFPYHPYSQPVNGTPETLTAITTKDLNTFVDSRFGRNNLIIGVAGDVTPAQLAPLLDKVFAELPAEVQSSSIPEISPKAGGQVLIIDRDTPQSVAVFGHCSSINCNDPDWYAASLVNHILGGTLLTSRLMEEVRARRGLAYGVFSWLQSDRHTALILGKVATRNDRFRDSLAIIRAEWRRMATGGPTETELADAKAYLTSSWLIAMRGTASMAGVLVTMQENTLGLDYLDKRNGLLERVTLDDAKRVAARLLKPDDLMIVIVGRPEMTLLCR